ncbi:MULTISPECIES: hypothetical protein [Paenibacillus]|uniref:hypothetical protein n=1 Tax=Paenibacillus TaxID=44249 RepID=UPI0022B89C9E|nr:hypothetical protein [Paenibacillus caseinilyticus]MCZ8521630.1 hypothetical protein [Paenibacillus caseinilyticus]
MKMKKKWICAVASILCAAVISVTAAVPTTAQAASNMVPDYEVKMLMPPSAVLGGDAKLTADVKSAFGMPDTVTKMNVQFLDTDDQALNQNGWNTRIRKTEGESGFELTYKKRYPVTNNDIDGALSNANLDGFDVNDSNYEAQIEWGYQKKTLSISRKKSGSKSGYSGMDLPNLKDSRSLLVNHAPDQFDDDLFSGWGTGALSGSRIYGPVLAKRSEGTWSGLKTYIEVWPVKNAAGTGMEYIVEISFKTKDRAAASAKSAALQTYLQSKGWFLPQDSLKTQVILDRY